MTRRNAPAEPPARLRHCATCNDFKFCTIRPHGPAWRCSVCGTPRTRLAADPWARAGMTYPPDYDDPKDEGDEDDDDE